jgi:4-amino-4-deoxy-L-arabinose transferase-like glycosyltransferase
MPEIVCPTSLTPKRLAPLGVIGLAAALRLYNLPWKSVDNDEAFSWAMAHKPAAQILHDAVMISGDPHPPFYWLTLKGWMAFGGDSEVSMRLLSALSGIIFVALVFYLGQLIFSRPAGTAAALFAALSSLLIWNSQDARMYTLGGTLALAGVICLVQVLRAGTLGWWLGYFGFTVLASYTHIGGSFLWPFEGLFILISALWFRRTWWRALGALGAAGLAYIPYALNAWRASGYGNAFLRYDLPYPELLRQATLLLTSQVGHLSVEQQWVVVGLAGSVFGLGILLGRETPRGPRGFGRSLTALFYLLPFGVMVILSKRDPVFNGKLLTFTGAGLALGVGAGWLRLWRWQRAVGAVVGLGLVGAQLYGVSTVWQSEFLKEDWRHAAHLVEAEAGPDDVVLVYLYYYRDAFQYYFDGAAPVVGLSNQAQDAATALPSYAGHDVVWLVQSGEYLLDPDHLMQKWMEAHYPEITEVYPSGIIVKGFAVKYRSAALPPLATTANVTYSNGLTLAGYRVPEITLPAHDAWLHPPSTWVHTTLYWSVAQPLAEDVHIAVTLEDEAGNEWGGDLPRSNGLSAFYPPLKWQPGEVVRQDFDINTNPALTPGEYKVVLRVYAAGSGAALVSNTGEDWFILERVRLTR